MPGGLNHRLTLRHSHMHYTATRRTLCLNVQYQGPAQIFFSPPPTLQLSRDPDGAWKSDTSFEHREGARPRGSPEESGCNVAGKEGRALRFSHAIASEFECRALSPSSAVGMHTIHGDLASSAWLLARSDRERPGERAHLASEDKIICARLSDKHACECAPIFHDGKSASIQFRL